MERGDMTKEIKTRRTRTRGPSEVEKSSPDHEDEGLIILQGFYLRIQTRHYSKTTNTPRQQLH